VATLHHFLKTIPQKKGIEKNLYIKKFIKEIIYSEENIQINLYFSKDFAPQNFSKSNFRDEWEGDNLKGNLYSENPKNLVCSNKNGSPFREEPNFIIPIIIPNTIHKCKKKNLS
jgi:hypothetical protein